MRVGQRVKWERGKLPPALGTVVELADTGIVNVRDDNNVIYWFPQEQLTEMD